MPNQLADETSPYLLQHKENPVAWHPWGDEALALAREEERPILLSIGYSSCHWCHVMERESFEDEDTAAYMNEHFVCIKVDREERPDVDAIYMEAVQSMTGHGGWPLTAFLDTDAVPFYAGTYFPPEPRQGMPSFRMVMEAVAESWESQRERLREATARIREQLGAVARIEPSAEPLHGGLLQAAEGQLRMLADPRNGGFGGAPKFPPAASLEFLLARGETEIVARTLDAMACGGIHDQVGGGFARYAVDARWLVPHFEKMLYDNALLARAYLHGFQALGQEPLARGLRAHAGLDAPRDARPRGRLLLGARRRLRGRGGPLLRLGRERAPRGPRRGRARWRDRAPHGLVGGERGGQLRGPEHPARAARPGGRGARRAGGGPRRAL